MRPSESNEYKERWERMYTNTHHRNVLGQRLISELTNEGAYLLLYKPKVTVFSACVCTLHSCFSSELHAELRVMPIQGCTDL